MGCGPPPLAMCSGHHWVSALRRQRLFRDTPRFSAGASVPILMKFAPRQRLASEGEPGAREESVTYGLHARRDVMRVSSTYVGPRGAVHANLFVPAVGQEQGTMGEEW